MLKKLYIGLLTSFLSMGAAQADQYDKRLPELFNKLKTAQNPTDAKVAEKLIWEIWYHAPNATAGNLLSNGMHAMVTHDYAGALDNFNQVIALIPDFAEAWHKRATILMMMQEYDQAKTDLEKALELEPHHFAALTRLAYVYLFQGQERQALSIFREALEINPYLTSVRQTIDDLQLKLEDRPL